MIVRVRTEDVGLELDYLVPEDLRSIVNIGSRVLVPIQNRMTAAFVVEQIESSPHQDKLRVLSGIAGSKPLFNADTLALAKWIAEYYMVSLNRVLRSMLPTVVRNKTEKFKENLWVEWIPEKVMEFKRETQLKKLYHLIIDLGGSCWLSDLRDEWKNVGSLIKQLEAQGAVRVEKRQVLRDPHLNEEFLPSENLLLTEQQQVVYEKVIKAIETPQQAKPILLFGVTGSGKTEVYLQAIRYVINLGKTALVLVPEISLTPQTIERFKSRFFERKERIAVLHSHLSEGERHDEWFKIHNGGADIVIGARSAIFCPLENIGLIIVDEEHESSYKQEEAPRYHARDLAVVRAKQMKAAVLLGSATPSLESYLNTIEGKYEVVQMTTRTDGKSMPLVRTIDMRMQRKKGTGTSEENASMLSEKLRDAVQLRLDKNEQVILFLNRRGYHTSLLCEDCGETHQCTSCAVAMTYHKKVQLMVCHVCGAKQRKPSHCVSCGSKSLKFVGTGTERVEKAVREIFPQARIQRVDTDTMARKNQLKETLMSFRARKIDILIGTQMIAKGLDFPNVTLVGVLNADISLGMPDFRASERTTQLLIQVAGRAGRGDIRGEVFIQTYTPHHPSIQFSRHNDFVGYATQELELRKSLLYPPYVQMILISCRSKDAVKAESVLQQVHHRIAENLSSRMMLNEPMPSSLSKAKGEFRYQMLVRGEKMTEMTKIIRKALKEFDVNRGVQINCDVNPYQLSQ